MDANLPMPTSQGEPSAETLRIPSEQELQSMSLEEIERLVIRATDDVNAALQEQGIDLGLGGSQENVGGQPPMGGDGLNMITPELLDGVSNALIAAGIIQEPLLELSPESLNFFTTLANVISPGVYNLQNEDDLVEFLNGIATGIIAIPPLPGGGAQQGSAPAADLGGGVPTPAGGVPGTLPAAGPGIIPGT